MGTLLVLSRVTVRQWMVLEHNGVMWTPLLVPVKTWCLLKDSPTIPGHMRLVLLLLLAVLSALLLLLCLTMSMLLWLLTLLSMSMLLWLLPLLTMSMYQLLSLPLLMSMYLLDSITQRFLKDSMLQSLRLLALRLLPNKILNWCERLIVWASHII